MTVFSNTGLGLGWFNSTHNALVSLETSQHWSMLLVKAIFWFVINNYFNINNIAADCQYSAIQKLIFNMNTSLLALISASCQQTNKHALHIEDCLYLCTSVNLQNQIKRTTETNLATAWRDFCWL